MSKNDKLDRPSGRHETETLKESDQRGRCPSNGFPGKLHSARLTAPDDATEEEVRNVAWAAWSSEEDVEDLWADVREGRS